MGDVNGAIGHQESYGLRARASFSAASMSLL
jgi:hypothetical protein